MPEKDPLENLLLDASEVNRALLAEALSGLVGIDKAYGNVVLKPGFRGLASRGKVLAYLLGRKAASLLGLEVTEEVAPKDIIAGTGLPAGTVHPSLKDLREKRFVSQSEAGDYFIASHQVHAATEELEKG